jgi:hypothetical protein
MLVEMDSNYFYAVKFYNASTSIIHARYIHNKHRSHKKQQRFPFKCNIKLKSLSIHLSIHTASFSSWSYQSTNPCTVLVNDKIDGHSLPPKCPSSVLQHSSSTEKVSSEQDQQELSSLGNNVGGKRKRIKRQAEAHDDDSGVVDVVFLGDGHANNKSKSNNNNNLPSDENVKGGKNDNHHEKKNEGGSNDEMFVDEVEEEKIDVIVEKRILLNISIGMDGGFGSPHLDVYHLQVAVPLPKQIKNKNFFSYNVVENDNDENFMNENLMRLHEKTTNKTTKNYDDDSSTTSKSSTSSSSTEHLFDDFIEASTEEGLKISFKTEKYEGEICTTNGTT